MDRVSFLLAPWGNPYFWKFTRYRFEGECVREIESFTTLPLLIDCLNPDHVVILALDTLAPYSFTSKDVPSSDYYSLVEFAREAIHRKLRELGLMNRGIWVEVLPGIGRYTYRYMDVGRSLYAGRITDYKYSLAYFMSKYFIEHLGGASVETSIDIILDLTHGINYMPTFTYDILLSLSRILKYRFRNVSFRVYNSDPFSEASNTHMINRVVDVKDLSREYMNEMLSREHGRLLKVIDPKYYSYVKDVSLDSEVIENLNIFTGSIVNGLPLGILTFYPDLDMLRDRLEKAVDIYARQTSVEFDGEELVVKHPLAFSKGLEITSKIMLVASLIEDYVEPPVDDYYSLDSLRKVTNIYDSSNRNYYVVHRELHSFEEKVLKKFIEKAGLDKLKEKYPITLERTYREFLFEDVYTLDDEGSFIRNFLSHAGLEKNTTKVKLVIDEDGSAKAYLKYELNDMIKIGDGERRLFDLIKKAAEKELISIRL